MPDISHKDAGFVVLVSVLFFVALIIFAILKVGRYLDRKEPNTLREIYDKIEINHNENKFNRALNSLLGYLKTIEANPMQHLEIGPVFALIAKSYLRNGDALLAYYYARLCEHYYSLFDVVAYENDPESTLIGNLRVENEKIKTQAGLTLTEQNRLEINDKINRHLAQGEIRGSADWIRLSPMSDAT